MNPCYESKGTVYADDGPRSGLDRSGGSVESDECEGRRSRDARSDVESRNQVVQANLGLVHRVARQFVNRGLTFEDLVGEGNLGLIRAAQQYDPSVGTQFSTYAYYWIREAIQAALANTAGTIRLPMNVSRLLGRWRRTEKSLRQLRGYPPTFEEVAAAMNLDGPTEKLMAKAHRVAQLQAEADDRADLASPTWLMLDEGTTAEETLVDREERESVSRRLEGLEGSERTVVLLKYGLSGEPPMSLDQIGAQLGMTPTAVQKTVSSAMRKLGHHPAFGLVEQACQYGSRVG